MAAAVPHDVGAEPSNSFGKSPGAKARFVYVGTYTFPGTAPGGTHQSQAKGIYVFKMNPNDGGLKPIQTVDNIPNPSYLALHPTMPRLYSVNEMTDGAVSSFAINQTNGTLTLINTMPTNGKDTTHLSVDSWGNIFSRRATPAAAFKVFRSTGTVPSET